MRHSIIQPLPRSFCSIHSSLSSLSAPLFFTRDPLNQLSSLFDIDSCQLVVVRLSKVDLWLPLRQAHPTHFLFFKDFFVCERLSPHSLAGVDVKAEDHNFAGAKRLLSQISKEVRCFRPQYLTVPGRDYANLRRDLPDTFQNVIRRVRHQHDFHSSSNMYSRPLDPDGVLPI